MDVPELDVQVFMAGRDSKFYPSNQVSSLKIEAMLLQLHLW